MTKFLAAFIFTLPLFTLNAFGQDSTGMQVRPAESEHRQLPRYQLNLKPHELPRPDSAGAKLVAKYCSQCHAIPSPTIHEGNEWDRALARMFWRMETLSRQQKASWWPWSESKNSVRIPSVEEQESLTQYIKKNSLRRAPAIPEPDSAGAQIFKYTCTQCHVLPDPGIHSADEWPATIRKMQKHLEQTILGPMFQEELDLLIPYLQKNSRKLFGRP